MFSTTIQNLINTSSQASAIERAAQLQGYVQGINKQAAQQVEENSFAKFEEVLKASTDTASKFKVVNEKDVKTFGQLTMNSSLNEIQKTVTNPNSKSQLKDMISKISKKHGIDEKLVNAVIKQESGFKTDAVSKCGAVGLMQLMPSTAKGLGVNDPYNPVQNVDGGVRYLKGLINKYNGNLVLALAAYNAGPGNVDKYDGVPPFTETQNYVKNILANYL